MADTANEIHLGTDEARGGETTKTVRRVLAISMGAALVVMSLVWIIPALNQSEEENNANVADATYDARDSAPMTDPLAE